MPQLPTIDLSQAHYDKVVSAFPGTTAAEKAQNYKDWLVNRLIERVEEVETQIAIAAVKASLPPRPNDPGYPGAA